MGTKKLKNWHENEDIKVGLCRAGVGTKALQEAEPSI